MQNSEVSHFTKTNNRKFSDDWQDCVWYRYSYNVYIWNIYGTSINFAHSPTPEGGLSLARAVGAHDAPTVALAKLYCINGLRDGANPGRSAQWFRDQARKRSVNVDDWLHSIHSIYNSKDLFTENNLIFQSAKKLIHLQQQCVAWGSDWKFLRLLSKSFTLGICVIQHLEIRNLVIPSSNHPWN